MTTLTHEAILRLHGPDSAKFLQGQTTADFESAVSGDILRGAFCDPKGRVLADFLGAVVSHDEILLRVRESIADGITAHLARYLMFSKATLERSTWSVAATAEDSSGERFEQNKQLLRIPRGDGLTELWGTEDELGGSLDSNAAQLAEIKLGEARIEAGTVGQYLPQDLNFDLNGAVSFTKGCYTGQEIVARLHYRGTPKRRLCQAMCDKGELPKLGENLHLQGETRTIGSVVNAAHAAAHCAVLIETTDGALEAGIVLADSGRPLTALT